MGGVKYQAPNLLKHNLNSEQIFRPTFWRRSKLCIWSLILAAMAIIITYVFVSKLIFDFNSWTLVSYVETSVCLIMLYANLVFSVWRLLFVSFAIGSSNIVSKSWFNELSIAYSDVRFVRLTSTTGPIFITSLKIWFAKRTHLLFSFEFSPRQLEQMKALIDAHLSDLKTPVHNNSIPNNSLNVKGVEINS